jgi:hypothetical protein
VNATSSQRSFLCAVLLLTSCSKQSPDTELQKKLTGNWILESGLLPTNEFQSRITVDSLGDYVVHASKTSSSNTVRTFDIEGIYQIKGGWLIDTVTNHSLITNKTRLPYFNTNRIVRLTEKQSIVVYSDETNETLQAIFRKEEK